MPMGFSIPLVNFVGNTLLPGLSVTIEVPFILMNIIQLNVWTELIHIRNVAHKIL